MSKANDEQFLRDLAAGIEAAQPTVVWIVREERVLGSKDGETNHVLSAHTTMDGSHGAVKAWLTEHADHGAIIPEGGGGYCERCCLVVETLAVQITD